MQISNDPNVWVIYGLVFVLGVLVGLFLTVGGRKKWKTRYYDEVDRRKVLEKDHAAATADWRDREKAHEAAIRDAERNRTTVAAGDARDVNNDGVVTPAEKKSTFVDRMLGRDSDGDGVPDRNDIEPGDPTRS